MVHSTAQDLGSTAKDGFQSSCAPLCRRQPVPLYVGDPQRVYRSQHCAGERKETQGHGTWQSRFGLFAHLILPLESGDRELALLGAPDGSVGTALNWVVGRTHGLPTFHGVDLRCFCLLGD